MNHELSGRISLFRHLADSRSCRPCRFDGDTITVAYAVFRNEAS
jgi:hypothetical protein